MLHQSVKGYERNFYSRILQIQSDIHYEKTVKRKTVETFVDLRLVVPQTFEFASDRSKCVLANRLQNISSRIATP